MPLDPTTDAAPDWYTATPAQPPDAGATVSASQDQTPDWYKSESSQDQSPDWYTGPETPSSSAGGAFARSAGEAVVPTAVGLEAAIPAAEAGAAAGTAIAPGVGTLIGGVLAGGAAALGAGYLASKGQDWILDKLGLREHLGLDAAQRQADTEQHPIASVAGSFLPALIGMRPDAAATRGARAVSAVVMGGGDVAQQYEQTGTVNPYTAVASAVAGAALPAMRRPSSVIAEALLQRTAGKSPIPQPKPVLPAEQKANVGGQTPVEPGQTADMGPAANPEDDTIEPAQDAETHKMEATPAISTTSDSIATSSTKAPPNTNVTTVGQPLGQGASNKYKAIGAQDESKAATTPAEGVNTQPSEPGVNTGALHPDVASVFKKPETSPQEQPTAPTVPPRAPGQQEQLPIQTGLAEAARPTTPQPVPAQPQAGGTPGPGGNDVAQVVQQATQLAMRRPIVEQPMPSIANSSRNMRGPVVVDPTVPSEYRRLLAVHETVEQTLMAQGMGYKQAHEIATKAEEQAVQAAGIDLTAYRGWFDHNQKHIEAQEVNPQSYANLDLHVDPEQAIGHYANQIGPEGALHADHPAAGDFGAPPKEGIPFMITAAMKQQLAEHGYSPEQIRSMTPADAHHLLSLPPETRVDDKEPVTATVKPELTDADKSNIAAIRERLSQPDFPGALAKFDALPVEEQLAAVRRGNEAQAAEKKTTQEAAVRPKLKIGDKEVQLRGAPDEVLRKKNSVIAWEKAYEVHGPEAGPLDPTDKAAILKRARDAMATAKEANGGADPLGTYRPNEKPDEYKWFKAARAVAANPKQANIDEFLAAHNLGGETGQDIDAELERKQRPDVETAAANKDVVAQPPDDFPKFDNSSGDESQRDVDAHNKLREWWNGLDDVDRQLIFNRHPDLENNVNTTQNPAKLYTLLEGDLEGLQKHRPGRLTPVDAEEVPGRTVPVVNAEDIKRLAPTEPGAAASEGKVLDKNSPEFKAAAERALAAIPKSARTPERLATEEAAARANSDERTVPPEAIHGSWGAQAEKLKSFGADEVGGGGGRAMAWATKKYHDYLDPTATPPEREYGEALDDRLHVLGQKHIRDDVYLNSNALQVGDYTAREHQEASRALEKQDISTLPQKMQDDIRKHYNPIMAKLREVYEDYRTKRPDLNLPKWTEGYVPRMRKGTETDPTLQDQTDVLLNIRRGLSGDAANLKDREFFEAVTPGGLRTVFQPEEGGIRIYVGGKSKHYDVPHLGTETNDPNYVGKQFMLGKQSYTVDHAWAKNIGDNVKDENGKPLQYIESPFLTASNAYKAIKTARDNWDMTNSILASDEFGKFSARGLSDAEMRDKGYEKINLPGKEFRGLSAAKPIARVLNDFSKPGFAFDDTGLMNQANKALTKMIFSTPFPHALNETALWFTQRGMAWLNPAAYGRLLRTAPRAMQSVNNQDYIQDNLAASGASPMLGGVLTRKNMGQIAQKMGLEVQRDAPKLDPIFKALGVSTGDLVNYWYKNVASKPMWWWSDFLLTQQFLEHQEMGASMGLAAKQSHEFISDYRVPTSAMPGLIPDRAGRLMSQAMMDSSWLMFGRYRYGLAKSAVNMSRNLVSPNATKQERVQALGNVMAMFALSYGVWPLANAAIQTVTNNPKAELDPAGLMREVSNIRDNFGPDATKDLSSITRGFLQPAPLIQAGTDLINNKDWKGDPIVVRGDTFTRQGAAQVGSFAANQVAPVSTVQQAYETAQGEGSGLEGTAGRVLAQQLGVKLPSPKAQKYEATIRAKNAAAEKAHQRKASPIERGINYLTGG